MGHDLEALHVVLRVADLVSQRRWFAMPPSAGSKSEWIRGSLKTRKGVFVWCLIWIQNPLKVLFYWWYSSIVVMTLRYFWTRFWDIPVLLSAVRVCWARKGYFAYCVLMQGLLVREWFVLTDSSYTISLWVEFWSHILFEFPSQPMWLTSDQKTLIEFGLIACWYESPNSGVCWLSLESRLCVQMDGFSPKGHWRLAVFSTGSRWILDRLCVGRQFIRQKKFSLVYLMLDCLARKRRYACCCCKELVVLGFVPCWRLVHTPHFRHPLVLFSFFHFPWLGRVTLCVDYWVRFMSPRYFLYLFFLFFNNIYEHLARTGICKTSQLGVSSIPFLCWCALAL